MKTGTVYMKTRVAKYVLVYLHENWCIRTCYVNWLQSVCLLFSNCPRHLTDSIIKVKTVSKLSLKLWHILIQDGFLICNHIHTYIITLQISLLTGMSSVEIQIKSAASVSKKMMPLQIAQLFLAIQLNWNFPLLRATLIY